MVRRSTRSTHSARGPKHCPITWQAWPHGEWDAIPLGSHPKGSTKQWLGPNKYDRFGTWKGGLWADFSFQTLAFHGAQLNIQRFEHVGAGILWYKGTQCTKSIQICHAFWDNWYVYRWQLGPASSTIRIQLFQLSNIWGITWDWEIFLNPSSL